MNKNTTSAAHIPHITKQAPSCGRTQEFLTTQHNILTINRFYPKQSTKKPSSADRKGDMERQKRLSEHAEKPFPENRKLTERPFLNKMQFMEHPLSERKKAEQELTYLCSAFFIL